ncbi:unnamed protein product [Lactuca saligna]|uniref:Uncharacterized protein n=1 Tax=Lactuca saligna TaxID=75948 RepID=A0AA36A450_LACSI|nr:unnamed protein product [Lactuca saligna]
MTNEFLLFIIPAITSQYISMAVKMVEMSVGPTTWKKLEDHANKAMRVKAIIELIAVHQMCVMVVSDKPYWMRFVVFWASIGTMVFMHVSFWMWSKEVKTDQVEKGGLSAVKNQV